MEVLVIGVWMWPGVRNTRHKENKVITAQVVVSAVTVFMHPEGPERWRGAG